MFQQRLALVRYESGDGKTFDFVSVSLVSSVLLLEFFVWNNSESSIDCNIGPMFFHAPRFVGIMSCFSSYQQQHEKIPTTWCDPGPIFHAFRIIKSEQKHAIALSRNQRLKRPTSRLLPHMMNARQVSNGWMICIHSFIHRFYSVDEFHWHIYPNVLEIDAVTKLEPPQETSFSSPVYSFRFRSVPFRSLLLPPDDSQDSLIIQLIVQSIPCYWVKNKQTNKPTISFASNFHMQYLHFGSDFTFFQKRNVSFKYI